MLIHPHVQALYPTQAYPSTKQALYLPRLTSVHSPAQTLYRTKTYLHAYSNSLLYPGISTTCTVKGFIPIKTYLQALYHSQTCLRASLLNSHISSHMHRLSILPRVIYSHLQVRYPTQTYLPRYTGSLPYSDISTHIYSISFLPRLIYPVYMLSTLPRLIYPHAQFLYSTQTYLPTCKGPLPEPDLSIPMYRLSTLPRFVCLPVQVLCPL